MTNQEKTKQLCEEKLIELGLGKDYSDRLSLELKDINAQDGQDYFIDITGKSDKYENEYNLLVSYLLGICDEFDINSQSKYEYGDYPDIDIDYEPRTRNILKEKYTREQFGEDHVCNVVTYTTFGLRSALIDMAKVFDLDRKEILSLTTKLAIKDDDGEILTWDKALEIYDDLREYVERNKEMAEAVKRILHRNRNMGIHTSGLIISGVPIKDFVPLVRVKNNQQLCSSWVEGLAGSDLGAVGLVKFDFLSSDGIMKIAEAAHTAGNLHTLNAALEQEQGKIGAESMTSSVDALTSASNGIGKICAKPGKSNWTDTRYLNDPLALKMANAGDLKMIFQYDGSDGIRRLAKQGGITSFDDLAAYTALYRPGPMKCLEKSTLVYKKDGWETIEKINPSADKIGYLCADGTIKFTNRFIKSEISKKKLIKIKLKNGAHVICSKDHRFLTEDGKFTEAKRIKINMKIAHSYTI